MATLYLVGTPIGNLEDISLRALRTLGEVSLIAAEDTRTTGRLLKHYQINTPMVSYHEHSGPGRIENILETLSAGDIALVSEAGMPGLSDPGYRLIQAAVEAGVDIVAIPGPAAAIVALVSSGLPTDKYLFLGFLPRRQKARRSVLANVADHPYTLVLYEAPHRLMASLKDLGEVLGNRRLVIGRELTKMHEEIWRGRIGEALDYFGHGRVRGELTLVIAGADKFDIVWDEGAVRKALASELEKGISKKEAATRVSKKSGWRTRDVYNLALLDT